ncbi:hypothetical protein L596_020377 [Steinernema carpocapsae]|uniref:Uncharacterized protein n=1 Tax=Steinernema carpocapsae TaxID=34508 RepID=A0A4U5MTC2_STECR|nr:hypothetical protein L596_020377 [Steinernema carpocapsae]
MVSPGDSRPTCRRGVFKLIAVAVSPGDRPATTSATATRLTPETHAEKSDRSSQLQTTEMRREAIRDVSVECRRDSEASKFSFRPLCSPRAVAPRNDATSELLVPNALEETPGFQRSCEFSLVPSPSNPILQTPVIAYDFEELLRFLADCVEMFKTMPPAIVISDIHGQYEDLHRIFKAAAELAKKHAKGSVHSNTSANSNNTPRTTTQPNEAQEDRKETPTDVDITMETV